MYYILIINPKIHNNQDTIEIAKNFLVLPQNAAASIFLFST